MKAEALRLIVAGSIVGAAGSSHAQEGVSASDPLKTAGSLMQLMIRRGAAQSEADFAVRTRAFDAATRALTSCEQAIVAGSSLNTEIDIVSISRLSAIPAQLQQSLRSRPLGHASPIYGTREMVARVLIACPANFRLPVPTGTGSQSGGTDARR